MFSGNRWIPMELADTMIVISICIALVIVAALLWFSRPVPSSKASLQNERSANKKKRILRKKK